MNEFLFSFAVIRSAATGVRAAGDSGGSELHEPFPDSPLRSSGSVLRKAAEVLQVQQSRAAPLGLHLEVLIQ